MLAVLSMVLIVFAVFWNAKSTEGRQGSSCTHLATGAVFVLLFVIIGPSDLAICSAGPRTAGRLHYLVSVGGNPG